MFSSQLCLLRGGGFDKEKKSLMVLVFVVFCFAKKAGARGYGIKFARGSEQGQREFSFASETRSAFQEKEKKRKNGGKKGKNGGKSSNRKGKNKRWSFLSLLLRSLLLHIERYEKKCAF